MVILLVIIVLCIRGCRGGGPKGRPVVVELSIKAADELAMAITVDAGKELAGEVIMDPDATDKLFLSLELIAAIKKGVGDHSVQMPEGVTELDDIGAVIIERITYAGQARDGVVRRIRLAADMPDPPLRSTPEKVAIGIDGSISSLYDIIPWPAELSWTLVDDDKLKVVSGETVLELEAGQSGQLGQVSAEIPVSIEEVDDTADIPDGDDVKLPTVKRDLGKVKFTASISVRYLGRLKITEDKQ